MNVGIRELKAHLSRYVEAAEAGERIEITKRGKVVAVIAAAADDSMDIPDSLRDLIGQGRVAPARNLGALPQIEPLGTEWSLEEFLHDRDEE